MLYSLKNKIHHFAKDEGGNIAMLFGLSIIAFFGMVGFAIDVSRSLHAQSALQNTMDKAVLSLAKDMATDPSLQGAGNATARQQYIQKWLDANHAVSQLQMTFSTVIGANKEITVTADATVPTTIMALMGHDKMDVSAMSQAVYSSGKAEIALVLDTTGSMKGSKLASLKTAATEFTTTLFAQPDSDTNLKMAVVPFNKWVNVGMEHAGKPWLNKPVDEQNDYSWLHDTFCKKINFDTECQNIINNCNAGGETGCWGEAKDWCDANGAPETKCNQWLNDTSSRTWQGCVTPRSGSYKTNDEFPNSSNNTKYPGKLGGCWVAKMLPLSTSETDVLDAIGNMWADGSTDIPIGLSWGWHLVSNREAFSEGAPKTDTEWQKFIVVMTDGKNTAYSGANGTMTEVCNNIKDDDIKIFAIAFQITDDDIKNRLKACATEDSYFYDASSVTGVSLKDAFASVSDTISNLRISK